jgi:hypothetical protein
MLERAVILSSGPSLRAPLQDLPKRIAPTSIRSEFKTIAETERDLIPAFGRHGEFIIDRFNNSGPSPHGLRRHRVKREQRKTEPFPPLSPFSLSL